MGGESTALSDCFGESETWDNVNFSGAASADDIFSILEALEESNESFEFQTSSSTYSPLTSAFHENSEAETGLAAAFSPKLKRQKMNSGSEIQVEEGQQRTTHITVERNRRKQMNDHLSVLRSLMPCFYVKRGDQASIIGGVVDYIHELKQVLLSLEAKKQRRAYNEVLSPRPCPVSPRILPLSPRIGFPISPRTPQPSSPYKPNITRNHQPFYLNLASLPSPVDRSPCNSSTSSINDSVNELMASSKSVVAEVEVKFSGPNLLLNTVSRRVPGQVLKIISVLEELALEILEVSISVVDETIVLNSFTIKIGIGCQLSAEELAHQIQQAFS
ncbi:transcription factor SPEECHLESS-like [Primulina tabacum]|uniref:transcription factor SPEECHLESS-like n=1 Tax=Primulina tabacum TaxID=48773 RepID=UPI003F597721